MARVRLTQIRATPEGVDKVGAEIEVPDAVAAQLVADRAAEFVDTAASIDGPPPPPEVRTAEHPAAKAGRRGRGQ